MIQYDSIPENKAMILTPLDIVYHDSEYELNVCHRFTLENNELPSYPVSIYLRERNYPNAKLTNVTKIDVTSEDDTCEIVKLQTNFTELRMDLVNYAELVFDITPDMTLFEEVNFTTFTLYLS